MKEHIKRVDRILKYKGSMLEIYTDVIETPEGHRANWDYIEHAWHACQAETIRQP